MGLGRMKPLVLDVMTLKSERLDIFKNFQTVDPRFFTRGLRLRLPSTWGPMTSACVLDTRVPFFLG